MEKNNIKKLYKSVGIMLLITAILNVIIFTIPWSVIWSLSFLFPILTLIWHPSFMIVMLCVLVLNIVLCIFVLIKSKYDEPAVVKKLYVLWLFLGITIFHWLLTAIAFFTYPQLPQIEWVISIVGSFTAYATQIAQIIAGITLIRICRNSVAKNKVIPISEEVRNSPIYRISKITGISAIVTGVFISATVILMFILATNRPYEKVWDFGMDWVRNPLYHWASAIFPYVFGISVVLTLSCLVLSIVVVRKVKNLQFPKKGAMFILIGTGTVSSVPIVGLVTLILAIYGSNLAILVFDYLFPIFATFLVLAFVSGLVLSVVGGVDLYVKLSDKGEHYGITKKY